MDTPEEIKTPIANKTKVSEKKLKINPFGIKVIITAVVISVLWYNFSPFFDRPKEVRSGAICHDGSESYATGSGACSHHGGVHKWLYKKVPHKTPIPIRVFISLIIGIITAFPVLWLSIIFIERFKNGT